MVKLFPPKGKSGEKETKDNQISFRINSEKLEKLKIIAKEFGLPYQTYLTLVTNNHIKEEYKFVLEEEEKEIEEQIMNNEYNSVSDEKRDTIIQNIQGKEIVFMGMSEINLIARLIKLKKDHKKYPMNYEFLINLLEKDNSNILYVLDRVSDNPELVSDFYEVRFKNDDKIYYILKEDCEVVE